ncbi:MAG: DoxX family protein [Luteibaculaceae bacterium]
MKFAPVIFGLVFILAGINHFVMPQFYLPLIPDYLPFHAEINYLSGFLEIVLGLLYLLPSSRKVGGWGIFVLLALFIPSHWHFIQIGSCLDESLCVSPIISWVRLILVQPLLMYLSLKFAKVI